MYSIALVTHSHSLHSSHVFHRNDPATLRKRCQPALQKSYHTPFSFPVSHLRIRLPTPSFIFIHQVFRHNDPAHLHSSSFIPRLHSSSFIHSFIHQVFRHNDPAHLHSSSFIHSPGVPSQRPCAPRASAACKHCRGATPHEQALEEGVCVCTRARVCACACAHAWLFRLHGMCV